MRWNNFGFTLGGPVTLLGYNKNRNKTFFFYSQEWRKVITYNTFNPVLPTRSMLTGTMLQPVCITTTTGCPAGAAPVTQIPVNLINPNSAAYIKDIFGKLPLQDGSTVAATTSGFFPVKNIFNSRQEMFRIDHQINEKFNLWGRVTIDDIPTTESGGLFGQSTVPNMATTTTNSPGRGVVLHSVNIFRPTLVNDVFIQLLPECDSHRAGRTLGEGQQSRHQPQDAVSESRGSSPGRDHDQRAEPQRRRAVHRLQPQLRLDRQPCRGSRAGIRRSSATAGTAITRPRTPTAGRVRLASRVPAFPPARPPSNSRSPISCWATSPPSPSRRRISPRTSGRGSTKLYAQDDFKVSPRLTLYLGVRWSFFGQPTDNNGQMSNFSPSAYDPAKAPKIDVTTGNVIPGTSNWQTNGLIIGGKNSPYGNKISNDNYHNFAPRIGLAWDPFGTGKTSIRAGYGIYHDATLFGIYEQNIFANPPYVASVTYTNASFTDVTSGTAGINPLGPNATSVLAPRGTQIPALTPYTQQWSMNIQQQLPRGAVLEVGYFGSKGTHLLGVVDLNQAKPGAALAAGLKNTTGTGANGPGTTVFTSSDWPRINSIRPFEGFNAFSAIQSAFDSNYHSLQAHLRKSFGAAGLIGFAYTFSKTLTDNGSDRSNAPQNSYNWHDGEYGPAPTDRRQVLTANYVYTLPFFNHGRGLLNSAAGGWQISGIVSAYTGQPSTITTTGVDPAGLGIGNGGPASARPDQICDPNVGAPKTYGGSAQSSAEGLTWFNTACFAPVPQGVVRPGNAGRYTVRGPGFFNLDTSIMKNFNISREGTWKLQVRVETFNTLNWVNPSAFGTSNTATNFGQITAFRAARRIQLGAKIYF